MTNRKTYFIEMLQNKLMAYYQKAEALNQERNNINEVYRGRYAEEKFKAVDDQLTKLLVSFQEELSAEWEDILKRVSVMDFLEIKDLDHDFLQALTSGILEQKEINYAIDRYELQGNYSMLKAINKYQVQVRQERAKQGQVFILEPYKTIQNVLDDYRLVTKSAMDIATSLYASAKDENHRIPLDNLSVKHFCMSLPSDTARTFEIALPILDKDNEDKSHYYENVERYKLFHGGELAELEFIKRA